MRQLLIKMHFFNWAYTWQDGLVTCPRLREIPVICNRKKKKK
jgi:hypothetical protein